MQLSAGALVGSFDIDAAGFGDFDTSWGYQFRGSATLQRDSVSFSIWLDYRNIEFKFEPEVLEGDRRAGGATAAGGVSLGVVF
ncbi:MAG: hypothetical protein HY716_17675 [Planctomycetes bacterium]|nr:hypothetical protein [Planctomycetota bacterium]